MNSGQFHNDPGLNEVANAVAFENRASARDCLNNVDLENASLMDGWLLAAWAAESGQQKRQ